ncbi:hypothetical protein [Streptomyces sp. DH10]|uniref:hypothetical protein n=1 Tax=Streptomyces sp. DH10 TaxID=3040121 RepID=UPI002441712F|nr:hypothetical protein [Streptomyces sp. DH10]MDG9710619.1 hypothetical protein [Streptomyces sp. DH10]
MTMGQTDRTQVSTRIVRIHQGIPVSGLMHRARRRINGVIDVVRLGLDCLPDGLYQPVPGLPVRKAKRAVGCRSRWVAMEPVIERLGVQSAMDVGANVGYYPIKLASRGVPTVAVESVPKYVRTTTTAVRRNQLDNVAVMELELRLDTLCLLPATDCTLMLSLWHHLVRQQGLTTAAQLVRGIWARTGKVMFFDSGENEMPESFGLPAMLPTPDAWLTEYLRETCSGGHVEHLGRHRAFDAAGLPTDRALFAVTRQSS